MVARSGVTRPAGRAIEMADEGARLRIFPVTPRGQDRAKYLDDIRLVGRFGDSIGFAGMLLFTGNDSLMEPWTAAHYVLANTKSMSPLIAVNPVYMHPFTVAKMISSMAALYNRQIYLNLVTGTAISDLHSLGDRERRVGNRISYNIGIRGAEIQCERACEKRSERQYRSKPHLLLRLENGDRSHRRAIFTSSAVTVS